MVFEPQWQPRFEKFYPEGLPAEEWKWVLKSPPFPFIYFRPTDHVQEQPVQHLPPSEISFCAARGNKDHLALAARFFRLFAKFATNRAGLVRVRVPSLEVTVPAGKGSPFWCGYHALEWAREDPRRVLFYTPVGFGTRPTGEVVSLTENSKSSGADDSGQLLTPLQLPAVFL